MRKAMLELFSRLKLAGEIAPVFGVGAPGRPCVVGVGADEQQLCIGAAREPCGQRDRILPQLRALFETMTRDELVARLEAAGLPFAPITRPDDLFDDPHLRAGGGLVDVTLTDGARASLPALPIEIDGWRAGLRLDLPRAGEHDGELLGEAAPR